MQQTMCKHFEVSRFENLFKREGGHCFMSATRIFRMWVNDKGKFERLKLLRFFADFLHFTETLHWKTEKEK